MIQGGEYKSAEVALNSLLESDESKISVLHQFSRLYIQLNETLRANSYSEQAVDICLHMNEPDKTCARIYANHADILKDMGNIKNAISVSL